MSINAILNTATSGLKTAQTGLRVVSDNVANVNTKGYVRKVMDQRSMTYGGVGQGVDVARIRLAADRFLQAAGLTAGSAAAGAKVSAEFLDAAQALFGDPTGRDFFDRMDGLFSSIGAAAADPTSSIRRNQAANQIAGFFDEANRIAGGVADLRSQADARISSGVSRANQLLNDIEALNGEIARVRAGGVGAPDAENAQSLLIDELSKLVDVKIQAKPQGGVILRTTDGLSLTGDGAATLSYQPGGSGGPETAYGEVIITPAGGQPSSLFDHTGGGELKALTYARDRELPAIAEQLGEFSAKVADELNRAHNAASAVPAPSRLEGKTTGVSVAAGVSGFTGRTAVAVTDATGRVTRRVDIDFTAGTMSVNGGAASAFTPGTFLSALDAALDPAADATTSPTGALVLEARGGAGIAVADDPAAPSQKNGKGFSHAFGLNDLVRSDTPLSYDTGLALGDAHGFTGSITLKLSGENGVRLRDVTVSVPAGGTVQDLRDALNGSPGGVGLYGRFELDAKGALSFTPSTTPPATLSLASDQTASASGLSVSELFGIGGVRAGRADGLSVRADIAQDGRAMALARFEYGAAVGQIALSSGDGRGGDALAAAAERTGVTFDGGRDFAGASMSLSRYASEFSGGIGARAAEAAAREAGANAVSAEADNRRLSVEGVNLDEELVQLTTYQQAYSASARLIQAAQELYDVLLNMT